MSLVTTRAMSAWCRSMISVSASPSWAHSVVNRAKRGMATSLGNGSRNGTGDGTQRADGGLELAVPAGLADQWLARGQRQPGDRAQHDGVVAARVGLGHPAGDPGQRVAAAPYRLHYGVPVATSAWWSRR